MNALIYKNLTTLKVALPPGAPPTHEALIGTAPYCRSDLRDDPAEGLCAAPFVSDVPDASSIALAPRFKAAGTSRDLLAQAHRDLRGPLTALLRLDSDWDFRRTDSVTQRVIKQQRQTLEVLTDLIDGLLTITESDVAGAAVVTAFASRSPGEKPREVITTRAPPPATWSAPWSMQFAFAPPESSSVAGTASRARCVLLIDEDKAVLGALRLYLLCAGYRVFAAASADQALDQVRIVRMGPSLIDIVIADADLTRYGDGIAAIDNTRRSAGYNVPAVLLMDQPSIEIGKPGLDADVSPLKKPVNVEELNALIGKLLKRPRARTISSTEIRWPAVGTA